MSTAELKIKIIEEITESQDENLLRDVMRLIELDKGPVYILSEEEVTAVQEAQADYKKGDTLTDEEAQKDMDTWFGK